MKKICFFDLQFIRHDQNAPDETQLRRILAGDKVFYTYDHQFSDATVLKKLVSGDRIFIGAHQLSDGTYWLHWLVSAEKGALQPSNNENSYLLAILKLTGSIAVLGLSAYGFCQWMNLWVMLLFFFVFCFGCWWCMACVQAVSVSASPKIRRLLQGFEQAQNGDVSFCLSPPNLLPAQVKAESNQPPDNDFDTLQASDFKVADQVTLSWVRGEATHIRAQRDFTGYGEHRRDFIDYQLTCKNRRLSLQCGYNSLKEDLNPFFYQEHPFFLALKDPVTLVVNQQDGTVVGVGNERDGCAYVKVSGLAVSFQQLKWLYKVVFGICLFMLAMIMCFIGYDWWQQGGIPDKWDWQDAADTLYAFALMGMTLFCGLMLVVEVVSWLIRKNSLNAARLAFARQMLTLFKQRCGKKAYIQEVN